MVVSHPQDHNVKRIATLLLLLGVIVGLAGRPVQAATPPMAAMSMTHMSQADMAAMPDCMAKMSKDAEHKPCKCGMGGCVAMMASGASFMLADGTSAIVPSITGKRMDRPSAIAALRGRSTAPEPEPPTLLG